jgi:membrane protein DedA with SNARE-associated domain
MYPENRAKFAKYLFPVFLIWGNIFGLFGCFHVSGSSNIDRMLLIWGIVFVIGGIIFLAIFGLLKFKEKHRRNSRDNPT